MIKLIDSNGRAHHVSAENIARVSEAAVSSQRHGIRSYVMLFDGGTIECQQTDQEVAQLVEYEEAQKRAGM